MSEVPSERRRRETREVMLEVVHRSAPKGGGLSRKWHKAVQNDDEKVADRGRSVLADVAESVCSGRGRCRRRWGRKVEPLHPGRTIRGANFVKPKHGARCAVERHGKVRDRRDVPGGEANTSFRFGGPGATASSAHAAANHPMLARGSSLERRSEPEGYRKGTRRVLDTHTHTMYICLRVECVCPTYTKGESYATVSMTVTLKAGARKVGSVKCEVGGVKWDV